MSVCVSLIFCRFCFFLVNNFAQCQNVQHSRIEYLERIFIFSTTTLSSSTEIFFNIHDTSKAQIAWRQKWTDLLSCHLNECYSTSSKVKSTVSNRAYEYFTIWWADNSKGSKVEIRNKRISFTTQFYNISYCFKLCWKNQIYLPGR